MQTSNKFPVDGKNPDNCLPAPARLYNHGDCHHFVEPKRSIIDAGLRDLLVTLLIILKSVV